MVVIMIVGTLDFNVTTNVFVARADRLTGTREKIRPLLLSYHVKHHCIAGNNTGSPSSIMVTLNYNWHSRCLYNTIYYYAVLNRVDTAKEESSSDGANTDSGTATGSTSRGSWGGGASWSAAGAGRGRPTAGPGPARGSCFEGVVRPLRCRVNGEDHSTLAMRLAVEPSWVSVGDGVVENRWWGRTMQGACEQGYITEYGKEGY